MTPRHLRLALLLLLPATIAADEAGPVVLVGESRPTAARLEEARKRLASGKPAEAAVVLQAILDTGANDLVPVGPGRSVSAALLAQAQLARLPAEERQRYRRRIDAQARNWLQQADQTGDVAPLRRLARDAFLSPQALIALDRLGDRAFERGAFDEAERWWAAIAPLDPTETASPETLRYPDPPADLVPRVRAKQMLARRFRGAAGWADDLAQFQKQHPGARGTLAGRSGTYAEILTAVAASLAPPPALVDWPTFGGAESRNRVEPAPPRLLDRLSLLCRGGPTWRFDLEARKQHAGPMFAPARGAGEVDAARRLAFFPVVVGHIALVADARYVTAYDLRTGAASVCYDAAAYVGGLKPRLGLPAALDLRYTLTVADDCVFTRLGTQTVRDVRPPAAAGGGEAREDAGESVLVSLSLQPGPDGDRRRWMVRAVDPGRKEFAVFEGAPVVRDGRVYIAATRFEGDRVVSAIHCYPAHPEDSSAPLLWRTDVCETRELLPAAASEADLWLRQRPRHHLLTLAGGQVVYCSHSGSVVAVDARTGNRTWGVRYHRRDLTEPADEPRLRGLTPPLFADGRLYVAPADSDRLLCLDPESGATVWERDGVDVVHLVGVGSGRLIFTIWRPPSQGQLFAGGLRAVNAVDGTDTGGWALPDDGGGLLSFGRPVLVGDLVLWPTARRPYGVFAVRQVDGLQPDNPALLHRIPSGNLVYANGVLLVADARTLHAFVPPERLADDPKKPADDARSPRRALDRTGSLTREGPFRTWKQVGRPHPATGQSAIGGPPLRPAADLRLEAGETCLHLAGEEVPSANLLLCARRGEVVARALDGGAVRWRTALPFTPEWVAPAGGLYLLGGATGVAAIHGESGARLWTFRPPSTGRSADTPAPFTAFHRQADRLLVVQDERRLLCLDALTGRLLWQRQAPGAHFEMPPPRGRFLHLLPIGEDHLLAQASGRRWLFDGRTGRSCHDEATTVEPWPRPPVLLGPNRVSIVTASRVDVVAVPSGRTVWTHTLHGGSLLSGEAPIVVPAGAHMLVVEPLNVGGRLRQLAISDGRVLWTHPNLLRLTRFDPSAWAAQDDTVFFADGEQLTALSVPGGRTLWQCSLPPAAVWQLQRCGSSLAVWPAEAPAVRFGLAWLLGSVQYRIPVCHDRPGWFLDWFDAGSGERLARINLDRAGRAERLVRGGPSASDLLPRLILSTGFTVGTVPTVTIGPIGCRIVRGDRVRVLQPDGPTSSR